MADALCGPSNPLQNFQKHTSVDRTLQQDRLTTRPGPSQGFRSNPGQSAGALDPEFEAFQAGHSPAFPEPQAFQHSRQIFPHPPAPVSNFPSNSAGWASDFQRLRISQTPSPQAQLPPQPATAAPSWHLDFKRHQQSPPSLHQPQYTPQIQHTQPYYNSFSPSLDTQRPYALSSFAQDTQSSSIQSDPVQQEPQYDAAAFEQQFEALSSALLQEERDAEVANAHQRLAELGQDVLVDGPDVLQSFDDNSLYSSLDDQNRLASELQQEPLVEEETRQQQPDNGPTNDEDLARTAGELLQRVADDTSPKFRESNFLSLMAQLRDHEVRVEGNDIVSNDKLVAESLVDLATPTTTSNRQRPSSVPPRRRGLVDDSSSALRDFRMAGALHDGDLRRTADNPSSGDDEERPSARENFHQRWLEANGLPSTHMVDDF